MNKTFHELYGNVRKSTLTLIKKHNLSPSDWDDILWDTGHSWGDEYDLNSIEEFIVNKY